MAHAEHRVDATRCKGDGICVEVCPKQAIEIHDGLARSRADRIGYCIACGQCVAVCPNEALALDGVDCGSYAAVEKWGFDADALARFLAARRSVRCFKDRPVERALLDRVLELAALAPPLFHRTRSRSWSSKTAPSWIAWPASWSRATAGCCACSAIPSGAP